MNFLPGQMARIMLVVLSCQFLLLSRAIAFALPDPTGEKAASFADIFNCADTEQLYEYSVPLENMQHHIIPTEHARKLAREYKSMIYDADLGLTRDNFSISGHSSPLKEVSETVEERDREGDTAKYLTVTFRKKTIIVITYEGPLIYSLITDDNICN